MKKYKKHIEFVAFIIVLYALSYFSDNAKTQRKVKIDNIIDSVLITNCEEKITAEKLRLVLHEINNK